MAEFISNLGSTSWWIGVVAVGIIINIISAYLKPYFDLGLSKLSLNRKAKLEAERKKWLDYVHKIKKDPQMYNVEAFKDLRYRSRSLSLFVLSVVMFLIAQQTKEHPQLFMWPFAFDVAFFSTITDIVVWLTASLCLLGGVEQHRKAVQITQALGECLDDDSQ